MVGGFLAMAGCAPLAGAQDIPVFRTETRLATVQFHVMTGNNYRVNLKAGDFELLEDGQPRAITFFENAFSERRAVDISLLFDVSGTVTLLGLLNPAVIQKDLLDDLKYARLAVSGFERTMTRYSLPTRDFDPIARAMMSLQSPWRAVAFQLPEKAYPEPVGLPLQLPPGRFPPHGGGATWLYESVIAGARDAAAFPGDGTHILVVFSDGLGDTTSEAKDGSAVCQELGIPVYPVVLLAKPGDTNSVRAPREREFASLGGLTGGKSFVPANMTVTMVHNILSSIAGEIRTAYVAGFSPDPPAGKSRKHTVTVRLRDPKVGKIAGGSRTVVH
jgi:hypothetical protein